MTGFHIRAAGLALVALMMTAAAALAASSLGDKKAPPLTDGLVEMSMGSPKAPVTVVEYASLTCPHCREFAVDRLPELKKKYIDTGLVRFVYRDYPLDGIALRASMIARCEGPDKYFHYVDAYFEHQSEWSQGDPMETLKGIARSAGMTDDKIEKCLADKELSRKIVANMQAGHEALDFDGTPTFLIDGATFSGALPLRTFEALFDTALINVGAKHR